MHIYALTSRSKIFYQQEKNEGTVAAKKAILRVTVLCLKGLGRS
jgi:hypothetical protein